MLSRDQIRQALIAGVPALGGRVYQAGAAALGPTTPKPFAVVRMTVLSNEGEWEARSARAQVWLNAAIGDPNALDALVDDAVAALHRRLFTDGDGQKHLVEYAGSPIQETEDLTYQSLARALDFMAYRLDWLRPAGVRPDPVAGLGAWARERWPAVATDPAAWDPTDATPGVYWRLERGRTLGGPFDEETGWTELTLRGHVLAPSADARVNLARRIVSRLGLDRAVAVEAGTPEEAEFWVDEAAFDAAANPFTDGQLTLRGRLTAWLADDPVVVVPGPTLETIHLAADPNEDGVAEITATVT